MSESKNPVVTLETTKGTITIELYPEKAPETVANFIQYTQDGFYDGTIFHRVIPNFMIQGGGFTDDMSEKPTRDSIKNEANANRTASAVRPTSWASRAFTDSESGVAFVAGS